MNAELSGRTRPVNEALVSVVLPVYNEAAVLIPLLRGIEGALNRCACRYEILFVNDGSCDGTPDILNGMAKVSPHVRVVHLARNFGHQAAVQAGLVHACGDAVVIMDADLQDDPESLPAFVAKWQEGYDVVYAIRQGRKEGALKKGLFLAFYRVLNLVIANPIPKDAGNFSLLDRQVVEEIVGLAERDRYFPGLRHWVGFRQVGIPVARGVRYDEQPRVSLRGLCRLAMTALFSFSTFPLTMFYALAALSFLVAAGTATFVLFHKFSSGLAIPGWASNIIAISFFGAMNALGIAILGEYVSRIYDQVRSRPVFIVARKVNFAQPRPIRSADEGSSAGWKMSG